MIAIKETIATYFWDKSICILWFWREWKSTLEFLTGFCEIQNKQISIHDWWEILLEWFTIVSWGTYLDELDKYDIIIRTAWLSPHKPELEGLQENITSQTELFFKFFPNKSVLVTWTKWKSTTVSLLSKMFHLAWVDYQLIWNIWVPPLDLLTEEILPERAVIEWSSYQLDWIQASPTIGILTSLFHEHHADWHWWETQYFMSKIRAIELCKHKIISSQIDDEYSILAYNLLKDNPSSVSLFWKYWAYTFRQWKFFVHKNIVAKDSSMKLKWKHNRLNACAVLWIADKLWIDIQYFQQAINSFASLEHRIEDCWIHWWIRWVNDAISTTPQSTIAALYTLWDQVETLFLWWKDGWYDFSKMIELIDSMPIKNIVLFWESWEIIKPLLPPSLHIFQTSTMQEAVTFAHKHTSHNKIALLSCASPSYWLRKNFEEKGTQFKQCTKKLPN